MKEINMILLIGIPIWPERKIYASFVISKNILISKCSIFDLKEELEAYFLTTTTICKGSPNAFALCKHNSFLFDPCLDGPPLKYSLYKGLSLKDHTQS